ncbi:MAG: hypothetical protein RLZZ436_726 [Planctomycetota bacterium]|jgi:hypothetical protein
MPLGIHAPARVVDVNRRVAHLVRSLRGVDRAYVLLPRD